MEHRRLEGAGAVADREWVVVVPPEYRRVPREEAACRTTDDWSVFAIHGNHVRPLRDREWYPGEPCRMRSFGSGKMFELPPGSVPYSVNALGHSANSWDPFVFPNPSRQFVMSQQRPSTSLLHQYMLGPPHPMIRGIVGMGGGHADVWRHGKLTYFRRRIDPNESRMAAISPIELDDLERQIWYDPEPRFEKPFKTFADPRYCFKGPTVRSNTMMRPGW